MTLIGDPMEMREMTAAVPDEQAGHALGHTGVLERMRRQVDAAEAALQAVEDRESVGLQEALRRQETAVETLVHAVVMGEDTLAPAEAVLTAARDVDRRRHRAERQGAAVALVEGLREVIAHA